jgi:hypothetical protein
MLHPSLDFNQKMALFLSSYSSSMLAVKATVFRTALSVRSSSSSSADLFLYFSKAAILFTAAAGPHCHACVNQASIISKQASISFPFPIHIHSLIICDSGFGGTRNVESRD